MTIYLKLTLIIVLIIGMMRAKAGMGVSLLLASLLTGFLFFKETADIPAVFFKSSFSYTTIKTVLIVYGVLLLSYVMKERHVDRMMGGLTQLFSSMKYAMIVPPVLIGLLPMPGGAMLPAAIIDSIGTPLGLTPEKKTYVNYWFRHIWEYFWPLYPGLILTASILQIPIRGIMLRQFYLTAVAFLIGMILIFNVKGGEKSGREKNARAGLYALLRSVLPIIAIIVLIAATPLPEEAVVLGVTVVYVAFNGMKAKDKALSFVKSFSADSMLLIFGVMVFKDFLLYSKALDGMASSISAGGASRYVLLAGMPFVLGFLTGINQAYVGIGLPAVIPFILAGGSVDYLSLTLFYASGFAGVLLSPVHLCLSLTREYYGADWGKVYKMLIPSVIPIFILPLILEIFLKK